MYSPAWNSKIRKKKCNHGDFQKMNLIKGEVKHIFLEIELRKKEEY